jgi:hypothetical protein
MTSAPGKAGWLWSKCDGRIIKFTGLNSGFIAPTSLAGKALGIFGGGAEQKKLKTIQSFFPHENNTRIGDIADVYVDALEYLRLVLVS